MDNLSELLDSSSIVEGLKQNGNKLNIDLHSHRQILPDNVRVIITSEVFRKGYNVFFHNSGKNILFFGHESHRHNKLRQWGFDDEWIKTHLLPETQMAEVIHLPINELRKNQSANKEEQIAV